MKTTFFLIWLTMAGCCYTFSIRDLDENAPWIWDSAEDSATDRDTGRAAPSFATRPTPSQVMESTTIGTPRACPQCPVLQGYDPVCGTDKITYDNLGMLRCAQMCGAKVEVSFYGRCRPLQIFTVHRT